MYPLPSPCRTYVTLTDASVPPGEGLGKGAMATGKAPEVPCDRTLEWNALEV
jgi:hypothetical protein